MIQRLGRMVNRALEPVGFRIVRLNRATAVRHIETDDPIEAEYQARGRPFVFQANRTQMRAAFFTADATSPFVRTLLEYAAGRCNGYRGSPLEEFYGAWQPETVAQVLGLDAGPCDGILGQPATSCALRPWGAGHDPEYYPQRYERREMASVLDRAGVQRDALSGNFYFGPVNREFGEVTFARLVSVFERIRTEGFRPDLHNKYITAGVLVRDGEYRLEVRSGKHRLAALAALGHRTLPVKVSAQVYGSAQPGIIRRDEVQAWPNVRNGVFSREQALRVFDRLFDGRHPSAPEPAEEPPANRPGG